MSKRPGSKRRQQLAKASGRTVELAVQLEGVARSRRSLETVEQHHQRPVHVVPRGLGPVEVEEIAVRSLDPFPSEAVNTPRA